MCGTLLVKTLRVVISKGALSVMSTASSSAEGSCSNVKLLVRNVDILCSFNPREPCTWRVLWLLSVLLKTTWSVVVGLRTLLTVSIKSPSSSSVSASNPGGWVAEMFWLVILADCVSEPLSCAVVSAMATGWSDIPTTDEVKIF